MARNWSTKRTWSKKNAKTGQVESKPYKQRYNVEQRPGETEMQYYTRLAKAADQRLVRIEQLAGSNPDFKHARNFAYARAMDDLEIFGGGKRFNTAPVKDELGNVDRRLFKEKIMAMRYFLESPTSTKGGIIQTYQRRADTLNETYGTNFSWKDLAEYFGKGKADKLNKEGYGSATALYAIGHVRSMASILVKDINQNLNVTLTGPERDAALSVLRKTSLPGIKDLTKEQRAAIRKQLKSNA